MQQTVPSEGTGHGQKTPSEKDTDAELETSVGGAKETDLPPAEAADKYPHGGRLVLIMAALCSAIFLSALDQVSIAHSRTVRLKAAADGIPGCHGCST